MVWSLALDDFSGKFCNSGPYPLMRVINRELGALEPGSRFQDISNILSAMPSVPPTQPVVPAPAPPTKPRTTSITRPRSRNNNQARRRNPGSVSNIVRRNNNPPTIFPLSDVAPLEAVVNHGPSIRRIGSANAKTNSGATQNFGPGDVSIVPLEVTNAILSPQGSASPDSMSVNIGPDIGPVSFTNIFSSSSNEGLSATNDKAGIGLDQNNRLASELSQSANIFSSALNSDTMQPNLSTVQDPVRAVDGTLAPPPPITLDQVNTLINNGHSKFDPKGPNVISLFDRDTSQNPSKQSKASSVGSSVLAGLSVLNLMNASMSEGVPVVKDTSGSRTGPPPLPVSLSDRELLNSLDQRNTALLRRALSRRPQRFRVTRRRLGGSSRTPPFIVMPASVRRAVVTISEDNRQRGGARPRNAFVINPRSGQRFPLMTRSTGSRNNMIRTSNNAIPNRLNSMSSSMGNSNNRIRVTIPRSRRPTDLVASIVGNQPLSPSQAMALRFRLNRDVRIMPLSTK